MAPSVFLFPPPPARNPISLERQSLRNVNCTANTWPSSGSGGGWAGRGEDGEDYKITVVIIILPWLKRCLQWGCPMYVLLIYYPNVLCTTQWHTSPVTKTFCKKILLYYYYIYNIHWQKQSGKRLISAHSFPFIKGGVFFPFETYINTCNTSLNIRVTIPPTSNCSNPNASVCEDFMASSKAVWCLVETKHNLL